MGHSGQPDMEKLWEKLPKNKDGYSITYIEGDIPYLYNNGFVDVQRFSLDDWKNAFQPFKQKDGTYRLEKNDFIKLGSFRYNKANEPAFDPFALAERAWPDWELAYLWESTIKVSSTITFDVFKQCILALKKSGQVNESFELIIDENVKKQLAYLLERFPSPRRLLEKEVDKMREKTGKQIQSTQKNRDKSQFVSGETASEVKQKKLKNLESSAAEENLNLDEDSDSSLDVKSFKKPTGKFRG